MELGWTFSREVTLGVRIVKTAVGTVKFAPDTKGCRSPSRALRRQRKNPLPSKAIYQAFSVNGPSGETIYIHPEAAKEIECRLSKGIERQFEQMLSQGVYR